MGFDEMNRKVIDEFHANEGKVGGFFEGSNIVLLHATGAKTGEERVKPLMFLDKGGKMVVFASKGGAPEHPDWYHNVKANPDVTLEVGTETFPAKASVVEGEERDRLYAEMVADRPQFGEYEEKTAGIRTIPVVVLERAA
jgi:deazaflavin-dependent oxidoreductase (nitroreductase family)